MLVRPIPATPSAAPSGGRLAKTSGDGPAIRPPPVAQPAAPVVAPVHRLLRHRLTSPEKRTVKRIQATRVELFTALERPSQDLVRSRILQMLREDRGLQQGLPSAESYDILAGWLTDDALSGRTAAELVGLFLREIGAMERPELSAPRVKAALRVLNEVLYGDQQDGAIPQGVRELRLEKRDGGLQIVGVLRAGADESRVRQACREALRASSYPDVDVRLVSRR